MKTIHLYIYCCLAFLYFLSGLISHAGTPFQRIAYIQTGKEDWSRYPQLFDGTYTHIVSAFLLPDRNGQLTAVDAARSFSLDLIQKAQAAGIKVLVAIGGSSVSYRVYLDIADNPTARGRFIRNVLRRLDERGYNGVDLDFEGWFEGLGMAERDQVNGLIKELAQAVKFNHADRLVTLPLAPLYWLPMSADCQLINSDYIDLAHHMSYDFDIGINGPNGPFRVIGKKQYLYPGLVSTERSVRGALNYLFDQGCRPDKLTAGIPFYNTAKETWEEIADRQDWRHVLLHPRFLEKADPRSGVWVTDPQAVAAKVQAYRRLGLAGVIVWQVGQEGTSAMLSKALLSAASGRVLPEHVNTDGARLSHPRDVRKPSSNASAGKVEMLLTIRSDWGTGYCADVRVSNPLSTALLWQVSLPMDDMIRTMWDAVCTYQKHQTIISGAAWNRLLAPGQSVVFGFCATRGQETARRFDSHD
jgi:spore germination protein YaaH